MRPSLVLHDVIDGLSADLELSSKRGATLTGGILCPNRQNGLAVKFGIGLPISREPIPSFADHISRVVTISSQEEMIGTDTDCVVAGVANEHPIGDRTEVQFPGDAMGIDQRSLMPTADAQMSILAMCSGTDPEPTTLGVRGLADTFPEACGERPGLSLCPMPMTEPRSRGYGESTAALAEGCGNGRMGLHREPPIPGAKPPAVPAVRGHRCVQYSTIQKPLTGSVRV